MDFTIRESNREAYVALDRGAQGNALKTILPMPVVFDPQHGKLIIEAHGKRHVITCGADPISQRAAVHDDVTDTENVRKRNSRADDKASFFKGTSVRIEWSPHDDNGDLVWPFDGLEPTATSLLVSVVLRPLSRNCRRVRPLQSPRHLLSRLVQRQDNVVRDQSRLAKVETEQAYLSALV
jgi:hypothetical protein